MSDRSQPSGGIQQPDMIQPIPPAEIERRSFELIEQELPHPLDPIQAPIIKRVIHTTADFSYA
ncbi:MAG: precorrin-8X methylmutase, partial [Lachnospiraceae bacterium]|nr:precorrin-8X methylmutase [Lachnospiraceae bacterium]